LYHIFSGIAVGEGVGVVPGADVVVPEGGTGMGIVFSLWTGQMYEEKKKIRSRAMRVRVLDNFKAEYRFERNIRTMFGLWQLET
jgi:hypothetical protein